jgi:hypothetical protein
MTDPWNPPTRKPLVPVATPVQLVQRCAWLLIQNGRSLEKCRRWTEGCAWRRGRLRQLWWGQQSCSRTISVTAPCSWCLRTTARIFIFRSVNTNIRSRDSDWLRAGRPRGRSSSPCKIKNFLFSTSSRPALEPTQPPIQWVPGGGTLPGGKAAGAWSWPLTSN